jgi:hypothetical protein
VTLSRTSRILLGFLLLALAAFLWVNFLVSGPGLEIGLLRAAPPPPVERTEAAAAQDPTVAPAPESQVARDLEILDLPFLVTEPPAQPDATAEASADDERPAAAGTARRATVNPFSPVIQAGGAQVQPAAQAPSIRETAAPGSAVTEVPVPPRPGAASQAPVAAAPKAPAPSAVTPGGVGARTLPRALPGGTLGGTPELLRSAIDARQVAAANTGQRAALREPEQSRPALAELGENAADRRAEPAPLTEPVKTEAERRRPGYQAPLQAGASPVSRYLRDNNVRFTGSVIGPVSVGVFRSSLTAAPVVISLGQTLPDTSIVLTDLRGQQAELTLGDYTQTLTLELRR